MKTTKRFTALILMLITLIVLVTQTIVIASSGSEIKILPSTGRIVYSQQISTSTIVSTELIDYTAMTTSEVNTFINYCIAQDLTEITLRLRAMYDWSDEAPSNSEVEKAKQIITIANAVGIQVNFDMHTWYTTWDNYFRDSASNSAANRVKYLNYVEAAIEAFNGYDIKAWMVLNEPQARTASISENNFILDIINTAKTHTNKPVSVRFMAGYSSVTGHYSSSIASACDFIAVNTYWDPRYPETSVYGTTEAKMNSLIAYCNNNNKELWITEFGKTKTNLEAQRAYVAGFVDYAKAQEIDRIYCWVCRPEAGASESYNIFDGYTPNPAFYELE